MCQIAVKHPPHRQRRNSCQLVPDQQLPVCADGEVRIKGPVLLEHASPEEVGVCWHRPMKKKIPALTSVTTARRSEEHTSELQSLMRISYAVFCLKTTINL